MVCGSPWTATAESITTLANEVAPDAMGLRTGLENRDEIGAVAAAIDRMLNRLETAFDSQKQFLEDASHELRTRSRSLAAISSCWRRIPTPPCSSATRRWRWRSPRSIVWAAWSTDCFSWPARARSSDSTSWPSRSSRCCSRSPRSCHAWGPRMGGGCRGRQHRLGRRGRVAPDRAEPRPKRRGTQPRGRAYRVLRGDPR